MKIYKLAIGLNQEYEMDIHEVLENNFNDFVSSVPDPHQPGTTPPRQVMPEDQDNMTEEEKSSFYIGLSRHVSLYMNRALQGFSENPTIDNASEISLELAETINDYTIANIGETWISGPASIDMIGHLFQALYNAYKEGRSLEEATTKFLFQVPTD